MAKKDCDEYLETLAKFLLDLAKVKDIDNVKELKKEYDNFAKENKLPPVPREDIVDSIETFTRINRKKSKLKKLNAIKNLKKEIKTEVKLKNDNEKRQFALEKDLKLETNKKRKQFISNEIEALKTERKELDNRLNEREKILKIEKKIVELDFENNKINNRQKNEKIEKLNKKLNDLKKINKINDEIVSILNEEKKLSKQTASKTSNELDKKIEERKKILSDLKRQETTKAKIEKFNEFIRTNNKNILKRKPPKEKEISKDLEDLQSELKSKKTEADVILKKEKILKQIETIENQMKNDVFLEPNKREKKQQDDALSTLKESLSKLKKESILKGKIKKAKEILEQKKKGIDVKEEPVKRAEDGLNDLRFELNRLRKQAHDEIDSLRQKDFDLFEIVDKPVSLLRNLLTSLDGPPIFRQGGFVTLSGKAKSIEASLESMKSFINEDIDIETMKKLNRRNNSENYKTANIITKIDEKLNKRDEFTKSRLLEKIPALGRLFAGSNRNYLTYLNLLRANLFDNIAGPDAHKRFTKEELVELGKGINILTGKGSFKINRWLGLVLFAPKKVVGNFQTVLGVPATKPIINKGLEIFGLKEPNPKIDNAKLIKAFAPVYGRAATSILLIAGITNLFLSDDISMNITPTSADFLKIKVGSERYDILGGLSQMAVFMSRLVTGIFTSSTTGKQKNLRVKQGFRGKTLGDIVSSFVRFKGSPSTEFIWTVMSGFDNSGKPAKFLKVADQATSNIWIKNTIQAMRKDSFDKATMKAFWTFFGVSLQRYDEKNASGMLESTLDLLVQQNVLSRHEADKIINKTIYNQKIEISPKLFKRKRTSSRRKNRSIRRSTTRSTRR